MRHAGWIVAAVLLCLWIAADVVRAKCPDAVDSYLAPCLIVCPAGDSVFLVRPRDWANLPEPGDEIRLDFSNCPRFRLSPLTGSEPYTIDSTGRCITVIEDVHGDALFPVRGGGVSGGGVATIFGCHYKLGTRAVASPDQNGDLIVDDRDVALIESKVGTSDATAEFDCDGTVTTADVDIARAHLGHRAAALVSVPPPIETKLALAAYPNPASRQVTVSLTLPTATSVTVDLLDLNGRRLQRQEFGVLGPGLHNLPLTLKSQLPPGVYLLRANQPGHQLFTKICVVS